MLRQALRLIALSAGALFAVSSECAGQSLGSLGVGDWLTVSANLDAGYHRTQFFEPSHKAALAQWDSRIEVWLPPFQSTFAWGPYVRLMGIKSSGTEAWENAWLGGPGIGFQVFPASVEPL